MTAKELMSQAIPAVTVHQHGKDAFALLSEHHIRHLPVVDDAGMLVGILSEEDIFNHQLYEPVGTYNFSMMQHFSVSEDEHLFNVLRVMGENRLTIVPVVDDKGKLLGQITQHEVLMRLSSMSAVAEQGSVLVLGVPTRNYQLSEIARIIEELGVRVLGALVSSSPQSEQVEITLKLNRQELSKVIATLERYEYDILDAYDEVEHSAILHDRYNSLMNYLNI